MFINKITKEYRYVSTNQSEKYKNEQDWIEIDDNSDIAKKIIEYGRFAIIGIENKNINVSLNEELKKKEEFINNTITEIQELKLKLEQTDYQAIKYAEGELTAKEYESMKLQRQEWRDRINKLETELEVQNGRIL